MTESWKQFQGHTVNGEFELREYLGGSTRGAAFLTEYDHQTAAIHLISENAPDKEHQLASWQLGTEVSHPNLIRVFQVGLSQIEDAKVYYAVMELPEENLGLILKQRALTPEETSVMLAPALEALGYLHKRELVHRAVNPANIGAIGDQLKLSIDSLSRTGEPIREATPYDPPETTASAAGDVWSLGMTIVETLTQRLPFWRREGQGDPEVPGDLTEPLLSVVRNCLRRDARRRWTVQEIGRRLNPAETGSSAKPPEPEITEPAVASIAKPETKKPAAAEPVKHAARASTMNSVPSSSVRSPAGTPTSSYPRAVTPKKAAAPKRGSFSVVVIILAALAAFGAYRLLHRSPAAPENSAQTQAPTASAPSQNVAPPEQEQQAPDNNLGSTSAAPPKETPAGSARSKHAAAPATADAGVVHQVLPDVPEKAARTIHGRFHVMVKVTTDNSGNVTDASLDSAGPSQYFANLALKAARQWKFAAGSNGSSDWLIRFDFTAAGTTASAKPSH